MPVPFEYPQGGISLVNSVSSETSCVPRPLWDILFRHSNGHLSRRLWKCSFVALDRFGDVGFKTQNESISMHRFAASG